MIDPDANTVVIDSVGMILFAVYHGIIIIVLVNMLIAMMSHSFESIQVRPHFPSPQRCAIPFPLYCLRLGSLNQTLGIR